MFPVRCVTYVPGSYPLAMPPLGGVHPVFVATDRALDGLGDPCHQVSLDALLLQPERGESVAVVDTDKPRDVIVGTIAAVVGIDQVSQSPAASSSRRSQPGTQSTERRG